MEKPKIYGLSTQEYPKGRIDSFDLPKIKDIHNILMPLFVELGFIEDLVYDELDRDFIISNEEYFFVYGENIKAHIFTKKNSILINLDTSRSREEIIRIFEKYFELP